MAEIVSIEHNGEIFDVEVPDGTPDAKVLEFVKQQQGGETITQPGPQPTQNVGAYAAQAAATPAIGGINFTNVPSPGAMGPIQPGQTMKPGILPYVAEDLGKVAGVTAKNATLGHALDLIKQHGLTGAGAEFGKAVLHPFTQQTLAGAARNIGTGLVQGAMAPENLMTLPYNLAAYEQSKIRQNPQAPGLEYNPYAQQVRGEFPTQGAAAAANRRRAIASQTYGGLSADEQAMLKADRDLSYAIRLKAARKVLGQE